MTRAPRAGPRAAAGLLLAAALLAAVAVAATFSGLRVAEVETSQAPQPAPTHEEPAPPPDWPTFLPFEPGEAQDGRGLPWLGDLLLVLWLVTVLAGLALLLWVLARRGWRGRGGAKARRVLRRGQAPTRAAADNPEELVAAVDDGLVALSDDDLDPRRAVIACWVRLEEAAVAAGVPRFDTDTPGDLVPRLLRQRQVSEPALAGLAQVYRLARYATHEVDEQMRTLARSALRRLRQELLVPEREDSR
ncbi:MAG TPA: DUF4129 domain-containing protein [Natronosporangium sp.]|nr:DUF4129 domain-containing protein [Natronosporangium sp.]